LKKIIGIFLIFSIWVYALDRDSTLKIYQDIFTSLSAKQVVSVYTLDSEYQSVFKQATQLHVVQNPEISDIILITNISGLDTLKTLQDGDKSPIVFVTEYQLLKKSEKIVGAIYWRKGRSQLLFLKNRLEKNNITLPQKYHKFIVEKP